MKVIFYDTESSMPHRPLARGAFVGSPDSAVHRLTMVLVILHADLSAVHLHFSLLLDGA